MGVQRATTLYPRNDTTVDTGTGIDIRLLASTQSGSNDVTQTCTALNTQDNVERTFDPATAGVSAVADARTLQKLGWALRLSEDMTPGDDTNCDIVIPAQTVTVTLDVGLSWGGVPLQASNLTLRAALFRYNPSTDTGTSIADGASASTQWSTIQSGTFKTITVSITVPATTFSAGEILLLQVGVNTTSLGNPVSGTITYTMTLRVDNATTNVALASALIQACTLASDLVGEGLTSRGGMATDVARNLVGEGLPSSSRAVVAAKMFDLVGEGLASRAIAAALTRSKDGVGAVTPSRAVMAARTVEIVGEGVVTRDGLGTALTRPLVGEGLTDSSKAVVAARTFDLVGEGLVTEMHPVQAFRTFDIGGSGEILLTGPNGSTITVPLDELPTGDCPADYPVTTPTKTIAGVVVHHETGALIAGATVRLYRTIDNLHCQTATSAGDGAYSFVRDAADPNLYFVTVDYDDAGTQVHGISDRGLVPS